MFGSNWEQELEAHRIPQALDGMLREVNRYREGDSDRYGALYAYATTTFVITGCGTDARRAFAQCIELVKRNPNEIDTHHQTVMWCIHNAAQMADCYETYFAYCDAMSILFPHAPLVQEQCGMVRNAMQEGHTWQQTQMEFAESYSNADGATRPTTGLSTKACLYSVMLHDAAENKTDLEDAFFWYDAVYAYTQAIVSLCNAFERIFPYVKASGYRKLVCENAEKTLREIFDVCALDDEEAFVRKLERCKAGDYAEDITEVEKSQGARIDRIADLIDTARLRSAEAECIRAEKGITLPIYRLLLSYDFATFYWTQIGDGVKALAKFEETWNLYISQRFSAQQQEVAKKIAANCAENAMLLCTDVNMFQSWCERLHLLAPNAPILAEIGQQFPRDYENGVPWWECMTKLTDGMYNRNNPSKDQKRYGNGAAIWQLMLANRIKLRLPTDIRQIAAEDLGILSLRIVAENARRLGSRYDPAEGILPVQTALPYVQEFVLAHPGNEVETIVLRDMRSMLK